MGNKVDKGQSSWGYCSVRAGDKQIISLQISDVLRKTKIMQDEGSKSEWREDFALAWVG